MHMTALVFSRWCTRMLVLGLIAVTMGCVAQQADVVRIKRELDAKIGQLDKSKNALQQAVNEANEALGKANLVIAQQRAEIKELLHARAEVMDQMATLKETDLSQVRGAIEKNQYQVSEVNQKLAQVDMEMKAIRTQFQQSEPQVHQLRDRLKAEEQLLTEQGGKLGEFRTSLVDYQQVLASLRQNVAHQEQQVAALRKQVELTDQKHEKQGQQVQANFEEIRQSMQSVVGTLEKVSTTFGKRLDEHEQKLSRIAGHQGSSLSMAPLVQTPEHSMGSETSREESRSPSSLLASQSRRASPSQTLKKSSQTVVGSIAAYASHVSGSRPALTVPSATEASGRGNVRNSQVMYEEALSLLRQGNFVEAAKEFSSFLQASTDSPLASNAQYWLGECYYGQRRFQEAIDEFERVFAFYPSSTKVPASLLKIAYSHLELQQPTMARSVFQQLVRTYPESPEAGRANGRLQEVNALLENPF